MFVPSLNGKPVVVLSNNDGCVVARSNEAKALDIPMSTPINFDNAKYNSYPTLHSPDWIGGLLSTGNQTERRHRNR
ncbi:DNA-directed DNA polymerase [Pontibacter sp. BAB1700]|nr:DNA-directed DNA polymerase [Pontibacter sp. BAB1700]